MRTCGVAVVLVLLFVWPGAVSHIQASRVPVVNSPEIE